MIKARESQRTDVRVEAFDDEGVFNELNAREELLALDTILIELVR